MSQLILFVQQYRNNSFCLACQLKVCYTMGSEVDFLGRKHIARVSKCKNPGLPGLFAVPKKASAIVKRKRVQAEDVGALFLLKKGVKK